MQILQSGKRGMRSWSSHGATNPSLYCRTSSRDCSEIQFPPPSKSPQHHHQPPPPPESGNSTSPLFMQEDDVASWLYYLLDDPFFDRLPPAEFSPDPQSNQHYNHQPTTPHSNQHYNHQTTPQSNQFYDHHQTTPQSNQHYGHHQITPQTRPSVPPAAVEVTFEHFARSRARVPESGSSLWSAVVDLIDAPAAEPWLSPVLGTTAVVSGGGASTAGDGGGCMSLSNDTVTCEVTLPSLSGGSGATATDDLVNQPTTGDRKRKGKELTNEAISQYQQYEDMKIDSSESRKEFRGPASAKRSRAAEVRNLSVRRRRNRINEKMRALQELVPRCNKTDKASMLDEAIEYFKSLQLQVQMMCSMLPMMVLNGAQHYMPPIEMDINQPTTPFSSLFPGSALPTPEASSLFEPKLPFANIPPDLSRIQPSNQLDSSVKFPTSTDAYLQVLTDLQMPLQIPQDQQSYILSSERQRRSRESEENKIYQW